MERDVEIVFTAQNMISQYGLRPQRFPVELARKYIDKGWARLTNEEPDINPDGVPPDKARETFSMPPLVVPTPSVKKLGSVYWISSRPIPTEFSEKAESLGYVLTYMNNENFDINAASAAEMLVVGSDLSKFSKPRKRQIRILLFQKKTPFVLFCDSPPGWGDQKWMAQAILSSVRVFYDGKESRKFFMDQFGDVAKLHRIVDAESFWKEVGGTL